MIRVALFIEGEFYLYDCDEYDHSLHQCRIQNDKPEVCQQYPVGYGYLNESNYDSTLHPGCGFRKMYHKKKGGDYLMGGEDVKEQTIEKSDKCLNLIQTANRLVDGLCVGLGPVLKEQDQVKEAEEKQRGESELVRELHNLVERLRDLSLLIDL